MHNKMCKLFLQVVVQLGTIAWSGALVIDSPKFDVRETIAELVHGLCPFADICDANATNAEVKTHELVEPGFESCCRGCSCHPDCKEKDNCCFPDDYKSNNETQPATKVTECLYTRLGHPDAINGLVPAYKTIVAKPEGGCVDTRPIRISSTVTLNPTCDDIDVTPLGPYFPVFSWDTGAVYNNVLCARCHGILNTEPFLPNLICRDSLSESVPDNSITNFLNFLQTGYLPPECYVDFNFTDFSALKDNRCYRDTIDTCRGQSITLPLNFDPPNLNYDVIQSLCESGLYSPTIDLEKSVVYKNAFCSLCGSSERYSVFPLCADVDQKTFFYDSFIFLLSPTMMHTVNRSPEPERKNEICLVQKGNDKTSKRQKTCKTIYCPTGMIRNDDGDCELIGNYLDKTNGVVVVKLTPTEKIDFDNESQEEFIDSLVQGLTKNSPWPANWEIFVILYRINLTNCDENAIAAITLRWIKRNTRNIYDEIEASTQLSWRFEWKENTYHLAQSLMDYRLVWISQFSPLLQPSWQQNQTTDLPPGKYADCGPMRWQNVYTTPNAVGETGALVVFNKLFFCDQIQLRSDGFILGPKKSYLESNLTNGILHDFEFDIIEDEDGSSARVCLSDTILAYISTSTGTSLTHAIFPVLFSDTVFILLTYI